jgi:hypothetical protein
MVRQRIRGGPGTSAYMPMMLPRPTNLAGLRPLIDRIVGNERVDGIEIPSFPGGE